MPSCEFCKQIIVDMCVAKLGALLSVLRRSWRCGIGGSLLTRMRALNGVMQDFGALPSSLSSLIPRIS